MREAHIIKSGLVYLVGAGPGDPGLITVKGWAVLRQAEVVVYDNLVNTKLLQETPPTAEQIYVGKRAGQHSWKQADINALLVRLGHEGKTVVRLKGGDPFVFGRGGEEAQALKQAGLAYEVVPGISSAVAVPAYAGIPITHRDFSSSFTVITGHEDFQRPLSESRIDWQGLVKLGGTLVFLMGLGHLQDIINRLIEVGQSPHTPAALIEWGTVWKQKTVTGELHNLTEVGNRAGIKSPVVTIIGEVVRLREELQWFDVPELRPLLNKHIVAIMDGYANSQLYPVSHELEALGAGVSFYPQSKSVALSDTTQLDAAIRDLSEYDWLFFNEAKHVEFFWQRLLAVHKDARSLAHLKLATANQAVSKALQSHGLTPDLDDPAEFETTLATARRILWPNAAEDTVVEAAAALNLPTNRLVRVAVCQHEANLDNQAVEIIKWLQTSQVDLLYFQSEKAVHLLASHFKAADVTLPELLTHTKLVGNNGATVAALEAYGVTAPIRQGEFSTSLLTRLLTTS